MSYKLLHRHGSYKGKTTYLQFGTYKSKLNAKRGAVQYGLDGFRIVPASKVAKTKFKGLYIVR